MIEILTIVFSAILGPLMVFFLSEKMKNKRQDTISLKKFYSDIVGTILLLHRFKQSIEQYEYAVKRLDGSTIKTIGFPNYSLKNFQLEYPTFFYNSKNLYKIIVDIQGILLSLNSSFNDIYIKESLNN